VQRSCSLGTADSLTRPPVVLSVRSPGIARGRMKPSPSIERHATAGFANGCMPPLMSNVRPLAATRGHDRISLVPRATRGGDHEGDDFEVHR
jgi:hypothetical protein